MLDDARVDEARLMISVLAQLETIHIRALRVLDDIDEPPSLGVDLIEALGVSEPIAEAIGTHLVRLAVSTSVGLDWRSVHSRFLIAPLGSEVLRLLRDV